MWNKQTRGAVRLAGPALGGGPLRGLRQRKGPVFPEFLPGSWALTLSCRGWGCHRPAGAGRGLGFPLRRGRTPSASLSGTHLCHCCGTGFSSGWSHWRPPWFKVSAWGPVQRNSSLGKVGDGLGVTRPWLWGDSLRLCSPVWAEAPCSCL